MPTGIRLEKPEKVGDVELPMSINKFLFALRFNHSIKTQATSTAIPYHTRVSSLKDALVVKFFFVDQYGTVFFDGCLK